MEHQISFPGRPLNHGFKCNSSGFIMMLVIIVGIVLLILTLTLHNFIAQQFLNTHILAYGEIAHFLAEAGINASIRSVRETLTRESLLNGENRALVELLIKPAPIDDISLLPYLNDTWNEDLKRFSSELDTDADIHIDVRLRDFRQTETDSSIWCDPSAKHGYISIESTGKYKNSSRTIKVVREIRSGNILSPLVSKFTFHVSDAAGGNEDRFNLIRNDHGGNTTDGPKPFIFLNHSTPESQLEPRTIGEILSDEADPNVFTTRGWIWLGGGKIRLNITSGAGSMGEIFHIYDVANSNSFRPIRFKTPPDATLDSFTEPLSLYWDRLDIRERRLPYRFNHGFIIEGFHDTSSRKQTEAMYEGNILSTYEKSRYGSKSSILHLYGEARKGYQSRTKVLGKVDAAVIRYANLEITPLETDVKQMFDNQRPSPMFLLPSIPETAFDGSKRIENFFGGKFGAPIATLGILFKTHGDYREFMSGIWELPYITSYNSMQDIVENTFPRIFPPKRTILTPDFGENLELKRGGLTIFKGNVNPKGLLELIESRTQRTYESISEFWDRHYDDESSMLTLNSIVLIKNSHMLDLVLPPVSKPSPIVINGGGMIILEKGNLILRGVSIKNSPDALTVVLKTGNSVSVQSPLSNHVNIYAPEAEFSASSRVDLSGTISVRSFRAGIDSQGGVIRYREIQDPTRDSYSDFYSIGIDDKDTYWHE